MRTKTVFGFAILGCVPIVAMGNSALYPTEKVTEFVIEKLDLTSLPAEFRPQKEKGKKTFADYGFTSQKLEESNAVLQKTGSDTRLSVKILEQKPSGIFVCVSETEQPGGAPETQRVLFVKRKSANDLLKGRESFREFTGCPAIGEDEASEYSGG
jgi:hypothetical protein